MIMTIIVVAGCYPIVVVLLSNSSSCCRCLSLSILVADVVRMLLLVMGLLLVQPARFGLVLVLMREDVLGG